VNRRLSVLVIAAMLGCGGERVMPRVHYNRGLEALADKALDKAKSELLEARDSAGPDEELRFRAARALGLTLAKQADDVEVAEPAKALELLRQSSGWYQDAARLRKDDDGPRADLEKVLRRIQVLSDKLNNQDGGIEAFLERIITDQRALRDQIRSLLAILDERKVSDPVGFQSEFAGLATQQRTLMAEVGTLLDRAGDERDLIAHKSDEEKTEKDKVRSAQLDNAVHYLERARNELAGARRELRRLSAGDALSSATRGLEELKRAKEQLLDPITVLRLLAGEEMQLAGHTSALAQLRGGTLSLDDGSPAKAPAWLDGPRLALRQESLALRTEELGSRLSAADSTKLGDDASAKDKRLLEAIVAAAPLVVRAEDHMKTATARLQGDDPKTAAVEQGEAISALLEAAELFADLRALIELTYQGHRETTQLLDPEASSEAALTTAERAERTATLAKKTLTRLGRLEGLLADEIAALDQQAQQAQAQAGAGGANEDPTQAQRQLLTTAQELRDKAMATVQELDRALSARSSNALELARTAQTQIEELRRLFYSIVEHLKELRHRQADTGDRTAAAESKDDDAKAEELGPLADDQRLQLKTAEAIAGALEAQADAASQAQEPQAAEQADRLGRAAEEVRKALLSMEDAAGSLDRARDESKSMSVTLDQALAAQPKALEHLDEAIRILEPPKQQDQEKQDQQKQDQKQDQQKQDQEKQDQEKQDQEQQDQEQQQQRADQDISKQEAQRRLEAIREREAERRRERNRPHSEASVDKDW